MLKSTSRCAPRAGEAGITAYAIIPRGDVFTRPNERLAERTLGDTVILTVRCQGREKGRQLCLLQIVKKWNVKTGFSC